MRSRIGTWLGVAVVVCSSLLVADAQDATPASGSKAGITSISLTVGGKKIPIQSARLFNDDVLSVLVFSDRKIEDSDKSIKKSIWVTQPGATKVFVYLRKDWKHPKRVPVKKIKDAAGMAKWGNKAPGAAIPQHAMAVICHNSGKSPLSLSPKHSAVGGFVHAKSRSKDSIVTEFKISFADAELSGSVEAKSIRW